eukprot:scaffold6036_cov150-Skeletonema_dohrnii-CCMP3373.AAC.9
MSDNFIDASSASHPDSVLRLSSAVHRFAIVSLLFCCGCFFSAFPLTRSATTSFHQPFINPKDQISFETSFNTCSKSHSNTIAAMQQADNRRREIKAAMASIEYNKYNKSKEFSDSEALMFELVLSIATYALSESNIGCDSCVDGDFPKASRQFAKAAGIFQYLGEDVLPNWMANSAQHAELENETLAETRVGVCLAMQHLYMAMAQQMAVATVLAKPGTPNYALLGKLSSGIAAELETFVTTFRSKSPVHMSRIDPSFLTLITFLINIQHSLGLYFLGRSLWLNCEYGVAIAAISEATVAARTRTTPTGRGLPEIESTSPLQSLSPELSNYRKHMVSLLQSWEKDNMLVYFNKVPPSVPADKALKPIRMHKIEEYCLDIKDPLPFSLPGVCDEQEVSSPTKVESKTSESTDESSKGTNPPSYDDAMNNSSFQQQVDCDLARELQDKLNSE